MARTGVFARLTGPLRLALLNLGVSAAALLIPGSGNGALLRLLLMGAASPVLLIATVFFVLRDVEEHGRRIEPAAALLLSLIPLAHLVALARSLGDSAP